MKLEIINCFAHDGYDRTYALAVSSWLHLFCGVSVERVAYQQLRDVSVPVDG
jgi:hypothetical protein